MYLAKEKGYEVYSACANTGGFSEEQLKTNEENAYKLGVTTFGGEDREPVWAPDGKTFYYLSEENGSFNIYRRTPGLSLIHI